MTWYRNRYTLYVNYVYSSTGIASSMLQIMNKTDLANISNFLHQFDNYPNVTFTVMDNKTKLEISIDEIDKNNLIIPV